MNFYNIALYPADVGFINTCAAFSHKQYAATADTYLVGVDAHPHVTLCQFEAIPEQIAPLWQNARTALAPIFLIVFNALYFVQGTERHENFIWTGLSAKRSSVLIEAQHTMATLLAAHKLQSLTPSGDDYTPHLTLARLKKPAKGHPLTTKEQEWPTDLLRSWPICFDLTLGLSDENGIYRQKLFPEVAV